MLDKTRLNQGALERYKDASTVRQVAKRMGAYDHLKALHRPFTGKSDAAYTKWRIQEAMVGYEPGQNDSPLPQWIRHYAKKAIQDIRSFDTEWRTGNDPNMRLSQVFRRARKLINATRMATDVAFYLAELEADPSQMYRNSFDEVVRESLEKLQAAEIRVDQQKSTSPSERSRLNESVKRQIGDEILPAMNRAIPVLEDMRDMLASVELTTR